MAKASTPTLLSLDQYAEEMQFNPQLFNQVTTTQMPEARGTNSVWYQHAWQQPGRASREQVATAIAKAEDLMSQHTGFWLAPQYVADERQRYPHPRRIPEMNHPSRRKVMSLKKTRFIDGGRRFVSSIEAGVAITRIDRDGDGFAEIVRFTVTHADAASWSADEIAVYPPGTTDTAIEESIRNLKVWISGTTITIEGQAVWFVDPALWDYSGAKPFINGNDSAVFLATVDVYRVYLRSDTNDYAPVVFGWQDSTVAPLAFGELYGVLQPWLPEKGQASLVPCTWDATNSEWDLLQVWSTRIPQLVRLYYLSGWPSDKFGRMTSPFARTVAAFATALLTGPVSGGGESINKIVSYWQEIPEKKEMTFRRAQCPFGPQRGAWEAWTTVQNFYSVPEGITV